MRQREEDMKWGVHNTSHRVQQPCGHMILWSTWIHGGCEHSSTLPGKRRSAVLFFGLLLLLLSQALVPITSHHGRKSCCSCCFSAKALKSRRSMYCPAQCALQQAPCFHPWAPAMNFSNSATDVTEVTGGMEYQPSFTPSSRVGNKKRLRAGDLFLQTCKSFP